MLNLWELRRGPCVKVVVLPAVSFQPVPTEAAWRVGIGHDRVLVFVPSGVMISIKSIGLHIGHESSVGVCFANRLRIYRIESATRHGSRHVRPVNGRWRVGRLVLVFAATRKEMSLLHALSVSYRNQYGKQNVEFLDV